MQVNVGVESFFCVAQRKLKVGELQKQWNQILRGSSRW